MYCFHTNQQSNYAANYVWSPIIAAAGTTESQKSNVVGPISSRTIFSASEARLDWNSLGTTLLIYTHSDVDNSNSSYYGATGLYIMSSVDTNICNKVEQSKEGPVNDAKWSPTGDKCVIFAKISQNFVE